jgi:hypothetical protein
MWWITFINIFSRKSLTVFLLCCSFYSVAFAFQPLPLFDSHSHYKTEDARVYDGKDILAMMDRENITHMVIVGEPPQRVQSLYKLAPLRIIPFLGLYESYKGKSDWMHNDQLPTKLEELLKKDEYMGIGEIHLFKKDRDNKNFKDLLGLADKYDLPVLFHGDAEVVDQVFKMYPEMTVIWAHLGTKPAPSLLKRMLKRYPEKLYIDTSVRDEMIMRNNKLLPQWKDLFISYSDRVLIGIDTFYTPRWENIDKVTQRIRHWLSFLPEPVARKLAYENAQKLFFRHN